MPKGRETDAAVLAGWSDFFDRIEDIDIPSRDATFRYDPDDMWRFGYDLKADILKANCQLPQNATRLIYIHSNTLVGCTLLDLKAQYCFVFMAEVTQG